MWARRITLRPMTSSEVLEVSLQIYQQLGLRILKLTAIPAVLAFLGLAFITDFVMPSFYLTSNQNSVATQILDSILVIALGLFVAMPIVLIGVSFSTGVTTSLVSEFILGSVPSDDLAVTTGKRVMKSLFGFTFLQTLIAFLPVLVALGLWMLSAATSQPAGGETTNLSALLAFGGILGAIACFILIPYIVFRYSLCPQIIVYEGGKIRQAMQRSTHLIRGNKGMLSGYNTLVTVLLTIGFLFMLMLPGMIVGYSLFDFENRLREATSLPFVGIIVARILQHVPLFLTVWVLIPIWTTVTSILYFDRRARHEGFDITLLAQTQRQRSHATRFQI